MEIKKTCNLCQSESIFPMYSLKNFGKKFNIMRCRNCGLTFRDILLNNEETAELYSEKYFNQEQSEYFFDKSEAKDKVLSAKLAMIENLYPQKGKILDVGCAIGSFLLLAKKSGWSETGIEVSDFASDYARKKYDLNVLTGDLKPDSFERNSFDIITMWDLIEHLEKPQEKLNIAFDLLKKDGLLIIQTTMEDSLLTFAAKSIYYLSLRTIKWPLSRCHPVHHATFYTKKTLTNALEKAGFEVLEVRSFKMNTDLVHTNFLIKLILNLIMQIAEFFDRPYERIFFARKK